MQDEAYVSRKVEDVPEKPDPTRPIPCIASVSTIEGVVSQWQDKDKKSGHYYALKEWPPLWSNGHVLWGTRKLLYDAYVKQGKDLQKFKGAFGKAGGRKTSLTTYIAAVRKEGQEQEVVGVRLSKKRKKGEEGAEE